MVEDPEVTTAPEETTTAETLNPTWIKPEHPVLSELKELARLTELALVWGIALV